MKSFSYILGIFSHYPKSSIINYTRISQLRERGRERERDRIQNKILSTRVDGISLDCDSSTIASLGTLRVDVLSSNQERDQGKSKTSFPPKQKRREKYTQRARRSIRRRWTRRMRTRRRNSRHRATPFRSFIRPSMAFSLEIRCEILRDFFRTEKELLCRRRIGAQKYARRLQTRIATDERYFEAGQNEK